MRVGNPHLQVNGRNLGRGYTKIIITGNKSMLLKELKTYLIIPPTF